jgi:predicted double-glycine peptidase
MRRSIGKSLLTLVFLVSVSMSHAALAVDNTVPVASLLEIRQHNVILQQWELSCAAAALATILRYQHGVPVTERSVALGLINRPEYLANPGLVRLRQGFSLLDMKRLTDRMGFMGIGLGQLSFEDLLQRAPVIVPINAQGYPHFVVFRGATSNHVLLADPAFGNVTEPLSKFLADWINYRELGHVGFIVTKAGNLSPAGRLRADLSEFPLIR